MILCDPGMTKAVFYRALFRLILPADEAHYEWDGSLVTPRTVGIPVGPVKDVACLITRYGNFKISY